VRRISHDGLALYQATPPGAPVDGFTFCVERWGRESDDLYAEYPGKPFSSSSKTGLVVDNQQVFPVTEVQYPPFPQATNGTLVAFFFHSERESFPGAFCVRL
jgi:hypothetical protein